MDRNTARYESLQAGFSARVGNALRRFRLRSSAQWSPLKDPRSGYTVIIPLPWPCLDLAPIPLLALQRANRARCVEVIVAVNASERTMLRRHGHLSIASMVKAFGSLSPRMVYFTAKQERAAQRHPGCDADRWLNIVNGLANCRTRHALLHDPETIVLDRDFFEKHFDIAAKGNHTFTGIQRNEHYRSENSADLLTPVEMMIDVATVRSLFTPIDLYQHVRNHEGRRIQCHLLCDAQWRMPDASRVLHEVAADQVLNFSPLFSQWGAMKYSAQTIAPQKCSPLPVVPYFRWLRGETTDLLRATEAFHRHECAIGIDGCTVDLSGLDQGGRDHVAHQIEVLDKYFSDSERTDVLRYAIAVADHSHSDAGLPMPEVVVNPVWPARSGVVKP